MDVFISDVPGLDSESFPATDLFENSFQFVFNVLVSQYFSSILWGPDHMVFAEVGTMTELVQSSIGHTKITLVVNSTKVILVYCLVSLLRFKRTHRLKPVVYQVTPNSSRPAGRAGAVNHIHLTQLFSRVSYLI